MYRRFTMGKSNVGHLRKMSWVKEDHLVFTKDDIRVYLEQHGDQRFYMALLNRMEKAEVCIDAMVQHKCIRTAETNCWKCKALKEWKESAGLIAYE